PQGTGADDIDLEQVRPEVRQAVSQLLAARLHRPVSDGELPPETALDRLGLDSLERMELGPNVEQRVGFSGGRVPETVGELWALGQGLVARSATTAAPAEWFRPPADPGPPAILGDTIAEAFVARALACRKDPAAADDLAGVLTYERLLVGTLVL